MAHHLDQPTRDIPRDGYRAGFSPSGFFISSNIRSRQKDPVIQVPHGHWSHTRNLEVINLARENHVDIICPPPHNSRKMRPLDKAFMGPLKIF